MIVLVEFHMPMSTVSLVDPSGLTQVILKQPDIGGAESCRSLGKVVVMVDFVDTFLIVSWLVEAWLIERAQLMVKTTFTASP